MTEFIKVARTGDLAPGERLWLEFEEETVVLFNIDGRYYCIADVCTHDGGPLEDGELDGYEVECPRHGACFDVRTGAALCLPAVTPIPTFEVKVEGDDIYIEDPDAW
ncbi:MAG: non-heme iron oxygenase ferredoxin subunit [Candidatus Promineifilaceae bacterium]|jgi:3-phenylpropionate/trans-cinnamate dioxygenase ferredoxin subunit